MARMLIYERDFVILDGLFGIKRIRSVFGLLIGFHAIEAILCLVIMFMIVVCTSLLVAMSTARVSICNVRMQVFQSCHNMLQVGLLSTACLSVFAV
jgi:hypothetical protein